MPYHHTALYRSDMRARPALHHLIADGTPIYYLLHRCIQQGAMRRVLYEQLLCESRGRPSRGTQRPRKGITGRDRLETHGMHGTLFLCKSQAGSSLLPLSRFRRFARFPRDYYY